MPDNPTDDSEPLLASRIIPGPAHLRQYPAHDLVAWQPQGVLDDSLLDEIAEWLCTIACDWLLLCLSWCYPHHLSSRER